jgi:hypothetical protein
MGYRAAAADAARAWSVDHQAGLCVQRAEWFLAGLG